MMQRTARGNQNHRQWRGSNPGKEEALAAHDRSSCPGCGATRRRTRCASSRRHAHAAMRRQRGPTGNDDVFQGLCTGWRKSANALLSPHLSLASRCV